MCLVEVSLALAFQLTLKAHNKNTKAINIIHKQEYHTGLWLFFFKQDVLCHYTLIVLLNFQYGKS